MQYCSYGIQWNSIIYNRHPHASIDHFRKNKSVYYDYMIEEFSVIWPIQLFPSLNAEVVPLGGFLDLLSILCAWA